MKRNAKNRRASTIFCHRPLQCIVENLVNQHWHQILYHSDHKCRQELETKACLWGALVASGRQTIDMQQHTKYEICKNDVLKWDEIVLARINTKLFQHSFSLLLELAPVGQTVESGGRALRGLPSTLLSTPRPPPGRAPFDVKIPWSLNHFTSQ